MLNSINPNECYVSEIVVAELFLGAEKSRKRDFEMNRVNKFFSKMNILQVFKLLKTVCKRKGSSTTDRYTNRGFRLTNRCLSSRKQSDFDY